ncbi:NERD domain-containing protein [Ammoniphilus resinae]|uniref:DNA-directed RNA polymerase subunit M/transcription elongation factor TFIIS n=1 Tax=Ammoniphilus resinae TaxID=861532 RepID=A0ABS4GVU5_9BACL|nr:NERD domain-containing protein [Ammoniphilus resinae]MBP1934393.1 DNA-directed RNA polymerase subunit M/transcription elongation factor TFIIS [Ammoniphilus resinae]
MFLRGRSESDELIAMRYLDKRMELPEKEKLQYLEKGYQGELEFDQLIENLKEERLILNDLLLEVCGSYFQIDSLMISQGIIHLFEIKNIEGDYYFESDKFIALVTGREYKNPLIQLKRTDALFRQLLHSFKQNYTVQAFVIFINPEFTLYQAPFDQPIILPTQINRFLKGLNKTPSILDEGHKKLAQKLLSLHQTKNPFPMLPKYDFDRLHKGIYCKNCGSFLLDKRKSDFVCAACGERESMEHAILRNVEEFKFLFPDRKITTHSIYNWCNADLNSKTYSRVLKKNYTSFGTTKDTYYR